MVNDLSLGALRVSAISALWTIVASSAAVITGLADHSLALVAFGAVGLFDCASSVVLVARFNAMRAGATAERLERIALRIVSAGLLAVGLVVGALSVQRLVNHETATNSAAAILLAAVSLAVLTLLALRKRHLAIRLPSRALGADGQLTAVGAFLAAVTLGGVGASDWFGWWWADPTAASITALAAIGLGVATARTSD